MMAPSSPLQRWRTYLRERFPVLPHAVLVLAFGAAAGGISARLRGSSALPGLGAVLVASLVIFLFFFQLRVADEFKDADDDSAHRPYRPVPRGLVSLRELRLAALLAGVVQLLAVAWLGPGLLLPLAGCWFWLGLMTAEFFAGEQLRARPLLYLASHMLIMPLLAFFAVACTGPAWGTLAWGTLAWFLALSFFNGAALEFGRKIRAPQDEEPGVETYSALFGRRRAVGLWLGSLLLAAVCALLLGRGLALGWSPALLVAALLGLATAAGQAFLAGPTSGRARLLERVSGLWILLLNLGLALAPLLERL